MVDGEATLNRHGGGSALPDSVRDHWTHALPRPVRPYALLARWDRPIGWWLLLWPCWWSVALALNVAEPSNITDWLLAFILLGLFFIGAIAMRGAGSTWNDITDRKLDADVARTAARPLPAGLVSVRGALVFLALQLLVGLAVLLQLPPFAIMLGFASVPIVIAYPFAKRVTDWPQVVLGLAFSWGALMGWAVVFEDLDLAPLLLYGAAILWTVGYDTIYAHQDREDDALIGVRSTARLFGRRTKPALVMIYGASLALFAAAFVAAEVGLPSWIGLAAAALHMGSQIARLDIDDGEQCLRLFRSNTQLGWLVFGGLVVDLYV